MNKRKKSIELDAPIKVHIEIKRDVWRSVKSMSTLTDISKVDIVNEAIHDYVKSKGYLNSAK